jgi:Na+/proline symporter
MEYSETRKWLKNLSRTIILIISIILAITYYYHLHQILGFSGVVLGSILVIITPALVHNKLVADTTCMRFSNYALMVYGVATTLVIGTMLIVNWNNKE